MYPNRSQRPTLTSFTYSLPISATFIIQHLPHSAAVPNLFPPKAATFGQPRLAASGLAKHLRASCAHDDGLSVAEDGGYCEATGTFDVHEE